MATRKASGRSQAEPAPISYREPDRESVRIEKISNGFLINRSGSKGGQYFDTKEYTAVDPLKKVAPGKGKR